MPNEPDKRSDFSLTELIADNQGATEEVDIPESGPASVSTRERDETSTATDDHGSFLMRDSFKKKEGGSQ